MKIVNKIKETRPEILLVAGGVGIAASIFLTRKAAKKENDILEEANATIENIHVCQENLDNYDDISEDERKESNKVIKKDLAMVYIQTGVKMAKIYLPAIGTGVIGIGCICASHKILKDRNEALAVAYTGLMTVVQEYRKRVADKIGKDKEQELYFDMHDLEVETITVDENGKEKKKKEKVKVVDEKSVLDSPYSVFFDSSSKEYKDDPEYNKTFLLAQQSFLNDKLKAEGVVYLNDVYRALDVKPENNLPMEGWMIGWHKNGEEDFIDFGLGNVDRQTVRRFVNGYEPVVLLDFNCYDIQEYLPRLFS